MRAVAMSREKPLKKKKKKKRRQKLKVKKENETELKETCQRTGSKQEKKACKRK